MKKIYFVADHKTGTFWTQKMMQTFCDQTGRLFIQKYFNGFRGTRKKILFFLRYRKKETISFIYKYFTKDRVYLLNRADIKIKGKKNKIILLIRDPRDICISSANYDGKDWNQEPKNKYFYEYQDMVKNMSFEEIVLLQSKKSGLVTPRRLCNFIKNNECFIVRYEDLVSDIDKNFITLEKICEYMNLNKFEKIILKNIYTSTHIKNNPKNDHVVSGKPSQYKNLNKEVLEKLNENLKEYILCLGYEI